ncbi:MAG: pyridoxamine 5'-phosphate oxidase [Gammaproteobacteria bacterium]|nr:pyridoxamine 5'-phosphate oxidase [Gammaproteobacteria bacterium]
MSRPPAPNAVRRPTENRTTGHPKVSDLYAEAMSRFDEVYTRARGSGLREPNQMNLATVGADGRPSSRVVLLKEADERGFVFYTNLQSRKGDEIRAKRFAALCLYWEAIYEQIRIEGVVEEVSATESDAYFASRDRTSQLGAWASHQSRPLASRVELEASLASVRERYEGQSVPRPSHWGGYRLIPDRIEFWVGREFRLHDRTLYTKTEQGWQKSLLNP